MRISWFNVVFLGIVLSAVFSAPAFAREATLSTTEQFCGCYKRYDISQAKVAFKGRYDHFEEISTKEETMKHSKVDLHFVVEDVYAGMPIGQRTMVLRTDTSSCGYGRLMMPEAGEQMIGGTFLVFAESGFVDICNSMIADETWAVKNVNPFIKRQPLKPRPPNFRVE